MSNNNRRNSILLACGIALVVLIWMLSGLGNDPVASTETALTRSQNANAEATTVRVQQMRASEVVREIRISARTQPNRFVQVKAETDGVVTNINAERGEIVKAGEVLLNLDIRDRNTRLAESEALVAQRELEYRALQNLRGQQFTTEVQIAEANARLEAARSAREKNLLEIRQTALTAPFDAIIQDRSVEIGDFVRAGDAVIELVDMDPLIINGEVNEREIAQLVKNGRGVATLEDGTVLEGTIRYIAPVADASTRTFSIELAVPNPEGKVRAGLTAQMGLYAPNVRAHTISPALLSLADDGTIGVKTVNADNIVEFFPVNIVSSGLEGINVTGLPDNIQLITVGQGFVVAGQRVTPVLESTIESNTAYERAN